MLNTKQKENKRILSEMTQYLPVLEVVTNAILKAKIKNADLVTSKRKR